MQNLAVLLEDSLKQLKRISAFFHELLLHLTVCADEGMELPHFREWFCQECSEEQFDHEVEQARSLGLLLAEEQEYQSLEGPYRSARLRLHTDIYNLMSSTDLTRERESLWQFLKEVLIDHPRHMTGYRILYIQVQKLFEQFRNQGEKVKQLYWDFETHLKRIGQLDLVFQIGEATKTRYLEADDQRSYAAVLVNQALILKSLGALGGGDGTASKRAGDKSTVG